MKVKINIINKDENCYIYEDIEDWGCETPLEIYHTALQIYGRCVSKIYLDPDAKHIGWVFQKRVKYTDSRDTFLQETWICPLARHEIKTIIEYAMI